MTTTNNIIELPDSTAPFADIWDACIDTEVWLETVLGEALDLELPECVPSWEKGYHGWDNDPAILAAINTHAAGDDPIGNATEPVEYVEVSRDNVYNNEQQFSSVFTYTVYAPADTDEWYYADDVYIAVSVHRGGDVRGNYHAARIFRADGLAEGGFLDWVIGWTVRDLDDTDLDEQGKYGVGYSSCPTGELESALDDDDDDHRMWIDGEYHAKIDGVDVVCTPYINAC